MSDEAIADYLKELRRRLRWRRGGSRVLAEIEDHLHAATATNETQGMSREEAAQAAITSLGSPIDILDHARLRRRRVLVVVATIGVGLVALVAVIQPWSPQSRTTAGTSTTGHSAPTQSSAQSRLRRQIVQLNAELRRLRTLAQSVQQSPQYHSVSGSIIAEFPYSLTSEVVLGIGRDQGVMVNDAVVAPNGGLVGRVSQVTSGTAMVEPLLAPQIEISAQVQGQQGASGTVVAATGTDYGELILQQVPQATRVVQGDTVITTALPGRRRLRSLYPAGIPIGRIAYVSNTDLGSATRQIHMTPFVNFRRLTDVTVLESR